MSRHLKLIPKLLYLISIMTIVSACEPAVLKTDNCVLDSAKIHPWAEFGLLEQPNLPYLKIYLGCGKTLIYVAANHTNDAESATYKMVQSAFENHAINFAVVEGFPSAYGINDAQIVDFAKSVQGSASDAEAYLAIRLAVESGAVFQGGEPSESDILRSIDDIEISPVDLVGFYILRQIPQLIRENKLTSVADPRLGAEIKILVDNFVSQTSVDRSSLSAVDSVKAFKLWYEAINKMSLEDNFKEQDPWPSTAINDPRPTNFLSDKVGDIRDQHIISVINEALQNHRIVLVVYGGSHHVIQEPALKAALTETD